MNYSQFLEMMPEAFLVLELLIVFFADLFLMKDEQKSRKLGLIATGALLMQTCLMFGLQDPTEAFGGLYVTSEMVNVMKIILTFGTLIVVVMAQPWVDGRQKVAGEFYELVFSTLLGMYVMMSSGHFLMFFLGLEMASVPMACLVALDKLKKDLADALAQRPVISAAIAEAREKGDLSENAEYDAARDAQALLELKIANLKNMVANAKVIDESQVNTDTVQMLTRVKFQNVANKMTMEYTIVGETEADFAHGKLAATTPIAKALMGHKVGEIVDAQVPQGIIKFKILDISL